MGCSTCGQSPVIGDQQMFADTWIANKLQACLSEAYQISSKKFWISEELIELHIDFDVLDKLYWKSENLCSECLFAMCCKAFEWDTRLLSEGVRLKDHWALKGMDEQLNDDHREWRNFFLMLAHYEQTDILESLMGDNAIKRSRKKFLAIVRKFRKLKIDLDEVNTIVLWLLRRSDQFSSVNFWDIVESGYRTEEDLELLDFVGNFSDWSLCPPLESLQEGEVSLVDLRVFDRVLSRYFGFTWDSLGAGFKASFIESFINNEIEIFDVIKLGKSNKYNVLRTRERIIHWQSSEQFLDFDDLLDFVRNMTEVRLPITSMNLLRYFGVSKEHILYSIDNAIDDPEYFLSARLLKEAPVPWINLACHLLKDGLGVNEIRRFFERTEDDELLLSSEISIETKSLLFQVMRVNRRMSTAEAYEWLEHLSDVAISILIEWTKVGTSPVVAREWKVAGFEPSAAKAWSREVDNPQIALRRIQAGISTPATTD
jgi:hypothetical protein